MPLTADIAHKLVMTRREFASADEDLERFVYSQEDEAKKLAAVERYARARIAHQRAIAEVDEQLGLTGD